MNIRSLIQTKNKHTNPYTEDDKINLIKVIELIEDEKLKETLEKVLSHIKEELEKGI